MEAFHKNFEGLGSHSLKPQLVVEQKRHDTTCKQHGHFIMLYFSNHLSMFQGLCSLDSCKKWHYAATTTRLQPLGFHSFNKKGTRLLGGNRLDLDLAWLRCTWFCTNVHFSLSLDVQQADAAQSDCHNRMEALASLGQSLDSATVSDHFFFAFKAQTNPQNPASSKAALKAWLVCTPTAPNLKSQKRTLGAWNALLILGAMNSWGSSESSNQDSFDEGCRFQSWYKQNLATQNFSSLSSGHRLAVEFQNHRPPLPQAVWFRDLWWVDLNVRLWNISNPLPIGVVPMSQCLMCGSTGHMICPNCWRPLKLCWLNRISSRILLQYSSPSSSPSSSQCKHVLITYRALPHYLQTVPKIEPGSRSLRRVRGRLWNSKSSWQTVRFSDHNEFTKILASGRSVHCRPSAWVIGENRMG